MDATQMISDSFLESDEEENEEENGNKRGQPLAKLCILKNEHIPETELPLFLGENVLGRDSNTCTLPLLAPSVSKQHATICISVHGKRGFHSEEDTEALVWDLGSMNGTRKGRLKLTPNVRYALSECDSLVVADIPCQYVRCAADTASSQGDFRTPLSKKTGVKARLSDASGEKEVDTSTGSKKCVNGGTEASVSLPDCEGTRETPVRSSCLSFEKTPTQPQGTLVPESDSDSEGERGGGADRRRKAQVSDSDSYKSSPTCSTFLSPTNKVVPESEDESPITPSLSTKNRPHRHVSFSTEETEVDVGRQQLREKKALAIVDNSEEEEGEEEERAALGGRKSEESEQCLSVKQENNVSLTGEDKLPVSAPAVSTDPVPAFNMDSDTDVEGEEEEVAPAGPVTLSPNQNTDQPPNTAQFHMDSDTDVDEDDDASDKKIKSVPSSADNTEPPHVITVNQPEAIAMDSDTDVDDDDAAAAVSDAASKAKPLSVQNTPTADSTTSAQREDFHLESDTDVDEEEEKERGTINTISKIDENPPGLDSKPIWNKTAAAAPLDSDTDDEATPAPVISEPSVVSAVTELRTTAEAGANVDILSDSDTDVEDEAPLVIPFAIATLSFAPVTTSEALQSDSNADTDVDDSSVPPAGDGVNPADLRVDSDTDVEDEEDDFGGAGDGQIPNLCREITPGLMAPPLQNCSTPVQLTGPEGGVEDMDTQAFLSPSSAPFRRAALIPKALSSCSESQEDEDFVVAETQSFVLQTRDCQGNPPEDHTMEPTQAFGLESSGDEKVEQPSRAGSFQLGLSDSSHLQDQAQALAMESTQAFVSVEGGVNLEETQAYAAISNSDRTSSESDSNLEATQAYGEEEEAAKCSVMAEKKGQVELALEATQAYVSEPYCDSEDETDEDKTKDTDTAETQPLDFPTSSTLAMAETQLMSAFEEAKSLEEENPASSVLQVKQNEEGEGHGEAAQPQERNLSEALSAAATQPMCASDDDESDDKDSIPGLRKRKAKPLELEEEQTQSLTSSQTQPMHIGVAETQPMATSGKEESDDEDSFPGPRKRKAKPLELEEEQTQSLTSSETQPMHIGVAETQPMAASGNEESDDEDSIPGPRKRKAKQLHLEEEETQTFTNSELSAVETQPMDTGKVTESDDEDSIPVPRKRKAKALELEEEQTQPLTFSEVSAVETQPMVTGEDEESDDEDSIPGLRKRKAKPLQIQDEETQPLTISEASTVDTQPLETKTVPQPRRGKRGQSEAGASGVTLRGRRGTRSGLREEEEQAECSEPPRRQTSRKNKALPATRGRRGKQMPDEDESEEGEKVERAKRATGKKSTKQQEAEEAKEKETRERKRKEQEEKERANEEQLKRERKEKEEKERRERENAEKEEKKRLEREEKARIVKERREQEEKERAERMQKEQLERERKAREEKERLEREKAEKEEKKRLEREEKARIVKERKEQEEKERAERMQKEQLERERKVKEEKERLEREKAEKEEKDRLEREEKARIVKERKEQEEKERAERMQKEEQLERERKEKEEKERLEREKEEKERLEREEKVRIEKERKEQEEKERLKTAKREQERLERETKKQEHQARLESEAKERDERETLEREKEAKEKQTEQQQSVKTPARGRRASRRTTAARSTLEPELDSTISTNDDVPARRTRSRSNSSNSVSSERSASSVSTQGSRGRGRGRGRGAKRTSEPPRVAVARGSNRRRTVAAEAPEQDSNDTSPQGALSRSNSTNSEISSCSLSSQSNARGGRQRGRGRKAEEDFIPLISSQSDQNSTTKSTPRGRKSRKVEESSDTVPQEDHEEKIDSQQATTTRGRRRANAKGSEPAAADEKTPSNHEEGLANEESPPPKKNVRGQKAVMSETVEASVAPAVSDGVEAKEQRKGRKRQLETDTEEDSNTGTQIPQGTEKAQTAEAKTKDETKKRGRASSAQAKKNAKDPATDLEMNEASEKMEGGMVERKGRGRPSAIQKKTEEQEESGTSVDRDADVEASEPQTPTRSVSRKRQAPADSSPLAKTPRSSCASPAAGGRARAASQAYKVLFTGVVDEAGERVLARLGGSMAKGVADMNVLVTDKVRRTVKFLCAVAKGVPIVTTHWLEKSGKAGSFLSPNAFTVKDPEQEKKFNFCLQDSLRNASSQPLLQGYEIHVTKSVMPEPVQMKDIISCSGATFLPKMPSSHKPQTVVISCEKDWPLCGPALSASLPVVTAEFILTGILQQKVDFQIHSLSAPASNLQSAGGRGRGRK